ncbi:uncharacterized protein LOC110063415 isoform X2 [Orbicella faveolata]|uniref:uncharacterized protein LOC110063415 isoform X2 n=1 Tax=Orbicella faveolata TaxID=48498 RepID=UPI0009E3C6C3|nr:uncharacterized protein LOC110063415 isoform X2 [Orbicella faveolata]
MISRFPLKPDKFDFVSRESQLTLSIARENKAAASVHLQEAVPHQLARFLDSLKGVQAYFASFKGRLYSSSRTDNKQNIEVRYQMTVKFLCHYPNVRQEIFYEK